MAIPKESKRPLRVFAKIKAKVKRVARKVTIRNKTGIKKLSGGTKKNIIAQITQSKRATKNDGRKFFRLLNRLSIFF